MRLLHLRFRNLNSLIGEWQIDLTDPAYMADGLFAITGPTGSGKSTLLDAICLALYGRTPRLARINNTVNDIMSRHTGECFAELTFETAAGRFRAQWSQRRARLRPDGRLQNPSHELANALTGDILESSLRGVASRVPDVTGMDFEQFTRSVLLAQGGFAAFLQASADERAPLLEQITGTALYSTLSIRVHERRAAERQALEDLERTLQGNQPLAPEQREELVVARQQEETQKQGLDNELQAVSRALRWLDDDRALDDEHRQLLARQDAVTAEQAAFQPHLGRLERAEQALLLANDHARTDALRGQHQQSRTSLEQQTARLPELEQARAAARTRAAAAEHNLHEAQRRQDEAEPRLVALRALIARIDRLEEARQRGNATLQLLATEHQTLLAAETQAARMLSQHQAELHRHRTWQAEHPGNAALGPALTGLESELRQLRGLEQQQAHSMADTGKARQALEDATHRHRTGEQAMKPLQQKLEAAHLADHQADETLQTLLENQTIGQWRTRLEQHQQVSRRLAAIVEAAGRHAALRQTRTKVLAEHDSSCTRMEAARAGLVSCKALLAAREQTLLALEAQQTLRQRVASLEEERRQLRDGEACPLCGATHHPFAQNLPDTDTGDAALTRARVEREHAAQQAADAELAIVRLEASLGAQHQRLQDLDAELATQGQAVIDRLTEAAGPAGLPLALQEQLADDPATASAALHGRLEDAQTNIEMCRDRLAQLEKAQEKREQARAGLQLARDDFDQASDTLRAIEGTRSAAASRAEQAEEHRQSIDQALRLANQAWNEHVCRLLGAGPGDALPPPDEALQDLRDRARAWDEITKQCAALEQSIHGLQAGQTERHQRLAALEQAITATRKEIGQSDDDLKTARNERTTLFGDTDPDAWARELQQATDQARSLAQRAGHELHQAALAWTQTQTRTEELKLTLTRLTSEIEAAQAALQDRLQQAGFESEDAFLAARLSPQEISELRARRDALRSEQASIDGQRQSNRARRDSLHKSRPALADTDVIALQEQSALLAQQVEEKRQRLAGLQHRLAEDDARRRQWQGQVQALEARRREVQRWDALHALIGSSDGKKFRNFAQGLTFEIMVGHANRQLQRMSDRYLLVRDRNEPLMLNVIDNYQAGDIRPTRNLSGGESFIVSLALALGLSAMSSEKIRVDSLFLDEGFGTLDEEALDVALDTLATLQQEGKLIGVISHVEALKERIGTRLQVTPVSGGRSRLSGPGVTGG